MNMYARCMRRPISLQKKRIVDFNQDIDSRLITEANMGKLAEVNIYPLRIAFDHWKLKDIYKKSIRTAVGSGIKSLSNYLLYNFEDKPEELYHCLRMNVDLCKELGASIGTESLFVLSKPYLTLQKVRLDVALISSRKPLAVTLMSL